MAGWRCHTKAAASLDIDPPPTHPPHNQSKGCLQATNPTTASNNQAATSSLPAPTSNISGAGIRSTPEQPASEPQHSNSRAYHQPHLRHPANTHTMLSAAQPHRACRGSTHGASAPHSKHRAMTELRTCTAQVCIMHVVCYCSMLP